jgi:hypothetical protein
MKYGEGEFMGLWVYGVYGVYGFMGLCIPE